MPSPHVLVLSPGSKVGLVRALAEAVTAAGGTLTAWESDPLSPAAPCCHARVAGGAVETAQAAGALFDYCVGHRVALVVPTRHGDLATLAAEADRFAAAGVAIALSSAACLRVCLDKSVSHAWLAENGFPVPLQTTVDGLPESALAGMLPLVVKDPAGSGSRSVRICRSSADLSGIDSCWIAQSWAPGTEYTVNVYVDRRGHSVCEIPHARLLVSEGEVVRGRTERNPTLMRLARQIAETLPGARGPINIQMFWDADAGHATVIEINPRFGGGYPLAHQAGGRFVDWLIRDFVDRADLARCDHWEPDLTMVRYREAAFFPAER